MFTTSRLLTEEFKVKRLLIQGALLNLQGTFFVSLIKTKKYLTEIFVGMAVAN